MMFKSIMLDLSGGCGIIHEDVEEIAVNIEILGTDDDPVIVFSEMTM